MFEANFYSISIIRNISFLYYLYGMKFMKNSEGILVHYGEILLKKSVLVKGTSFSHTVKVCYHSNINEKAVYAL